MKKITLTLFTFLAFQWYSSAQECFQNASNFGNNSTIPSYNVTGDVSITLKAIEQEIILDLGDNFRTAAGPDIRVFLVNSNGLSDTQLSTTRISDLENIQFGLVGNLDTVNQNGAKTFTVSIPDGTNIQDFDKIFFYCLEFNQFWDFGNFTPFSGANCNVLSIEENSLEISAMYPNPAKNTLYISTTANSNAKMNIFDTNGKIVMHIDNTNKPIDISSLSAGLYLVEITSLKQRNIKRLIIN